MIIEWKSGIYSQNQNYYGTGLSLNWLSARLIVRVLQVMAITSQYRSLNITITENRLVEIITSQYRQLQTITSQNRFIKPITTMYRKVRGITSGG